jgi:hypothetical protein
MYKKRIKDWAIDKNLKSEKPPASPRMKQQRNSPQSQPQSGISSAAIDGQRLSNYADSSPDPYQSFQYGTRPSAEEAMQRGYHTPTTTWPLQQPGDGQHWAGVGQSHGDGSYSSSLTQSGQAGGQPPSSILLGTIRDRFLEASDAISRHDTAVLFEILNPAYEAISSVSETETTQLLAVVVDVFQLLSTRPNHQDMLRQLLQYVFALIPAAGRRNQFLSTNSQVLTLMGQSGYASPSRVPSGTACGADSRPTASSHDYNYDYYEQPTAAGPASGNRSGGYCVHPY